uniref:histidine kinase n=1 Tax=Solibacter usitatus (strain Ellin6076) TaxID=234267 RepID=Q01U21_SOLUE
MLLRHALGPFLGGHYPFLLQFCAMLAAARFLGFGPGLAALLTALSPSLYVLEKHSQPELPVARLLGFSGAVLFCLFLVWLLDRQGRMRVEVQRSTRLAEERLEVLSIEVAQRERDQEFAAQLRDIVESSEDAIISKDMNGIIRSWNDGAERLFGYSKEETIGQHITLVVPESRRHEEAGILARIGEGLPVKHFETVRCRKDGRLIHVSLTISPVRETSGRIVGASHIARDITERMELEEQLRQTQKLESLGVLAGGMAHDFNNLLTGVMGNASLIAEELGPESSAAPRLSEIMHASERAAQLVRQMLAYAGKGRFVMQHLDISEQIAGIAPLIRTSITPSVQLEFNLAENLPAVECDASQIQQLIMNLATNAGEAIESHGTVTITTSTHRTGSERQVVIEVKDTGCGMDETTRARIFDPFFTTKFTGRGLGLAAVLGIIRSHNGSISVESTPGRGSTFTVALPATAQDVEPAQPDPHLELHGAGHVLVVDDEDLVRNMARSALERCGYTVEVAADGLLAVQAVTARPAHFDAVLLDLTMPAMNGDEALKEIHAIRSDIPVILSSGFSETEALRRFQHRGLAGFLQKPYTASVLARKVKQAIDRPHRASAQANG